MNIYGATMIDTVRNFAALSCIMIVHLMLCMQLILALDSLYKRRKGRRREKKQPSISINRFSLSLLRLWK